MNAPQNHAAGTSPTTDFQQVLKRRKALAMGAAAALTVAGCNLMSPQTAAPAPAAPAPSTTDELIHSYTSDIEQALDPVDRQRLDKAKQAGQVASKETAKPVAIKTEPGKNDVVVADVAKTEPPKNTAALTPAPTTAPAIATPITVEMPTTPPVILASAGTAAGKDKNDPPREAIAEKSEPAAMTPAAHSAPVNPVTETPATKPASTPMPMGGVVLAAPNELNQPALVTPAVSPTTPPASAMGSMTAMLAPPAVQAVAAAPQIVASAEPTLEDALTVVRKNIASHPTFNTALAMALLDGSKTPDSDMVKSLTEPDQKMLADLVAALDTMKTTASNATAPLSERAAPILDATKKWQADADLGLPRLVLANRVDSFGVFTGVDPVFEQGKRHTIIIYCEVANFGSKKGDDGWFTTKLTQQESLITDDNLLVWRPNAEEVEDRSLNQRHDFYLVKKLTLPETLAAGKYTLRMDVTDANTGKRALKSMDIQLVNK